MANINRKEFLALVSLSGFAVGLVPLADKLLNQETAVVPGQDLQHTPIELNGLENPENTQFIRKIHLPTISGIPDSARADRMQELFLSPENSNKIAKEINSGFEVISSNSRRDLEDYSKTLNTLLSNEVSVEGLLLYIPNTSIDDDSLAKVLVRGEIPKEGEDLWSEKVTTRCILEIHSKDLEKLLNQTPTDTHKLLAGIVESSGLPRRDGIIFKQDSPLEAFKENPRLGFEVEQTSKNHALNTNSTFVKGWEYDTQDKDKKIGTAVAIPTGMEIGHIARFVHTTKGDYCIVSFEGKAVYSGSSNEELKKINDEIAYGLRGWYLVPANSVIPQSILEKNNEPALE